jgi:hypothetical protein
MIWRFSTVTKPLLLCREMCRLRSIGVRPEALCDPLLVRGQEGEIYLGRLDAGVTENLLQVVD